MGGLPFLLLCNNNIIKLPLKLYNFYKQVLLAWHLIYKHNFSLHSYFIWNNGDILYKSKSLFFPNWVNNNILVSELINSDGYLQVHLRKLEYGEKVSCNISKSETFIYFRFITCKVKHFKSFIVLILMIRAYSS